LLKASARLKPTRGFEPRRSGARDEKDAAKVAINYGDARRGRVELDVLASEVDDLAGKGRKVAKRGRKPKGQA